MLHQVGAGCASTSVQPSTQLVASEDWWPGTDSTDLQNKNRHVGDDQRSTAVVKSRCLEGVGRRKAHMLLHKHLSSYRPLASQGLLQQKVLPVEYSIMFSLPSKPHTLSEHVTKDNKLQLHNWNRFQLPSSCLFWTWHLRPSSDMWRPNTTFSLHRWV